MVKILLVDDDPLLIRMYQTKFVNDGYDVETGNDGDQVVEKAKAFNPDLIIMDVMMPHLNGLEALQLLKADPQTKKFPVILLTNVSGSVGDAEKGMEYGAIAYLVKADFTPAEVVAKVQEILDAYLRDRTEAKIQS